MYIAHPVDWRYGSEEMRKLLSVENWVKTYAQIEAIVAKVQSELGIIPKSAAEDISKAATKIKVDEVLEEEKKTKHDIIALINVLSRHCSREDSKKYIHWGLTSQDIKDTALALILKQALELIESRLKQLINELVALAEKYSDTLCVGRTHGVHANIYSLGYKFAVFADEFLRHLERLSEGKKRFLVGKTSGALGIHTVMGEDGLQVEKIVMERLGLYQSEFSTQVVLRDRYAEFFLILALISSSLDRLATEIRNLHRTEINEVLEGFEKGQKGSSAMPHKRNPINSENISGLARIIRGLVIPVLENIVLWHERDLTNSSSERVLIADFLLLLDEQLSRAIRVVKNLKIDLNGIRKNLELSKGLIFSELIMYKLIEAGYTRIDAYNKVMDLSREVVEKDEHVIEIIKRDQTISADVKSSILEVFKNPQKYLSTAKELINKLRSRVKTFL